MEFLRPDEQLIEKGTADGEIPRFPGIDRGAESIILQNGDDLCARCNEDQGIMIEAYTPYGIILYLHDWGEDGSSVGYKKMFIPYSNIGMIVDEKVDE